MTCCTELSKGSIAPVVHPRRLLVAALPAGAHAIPGGGIDAYRVASGSIPSGGALDTAQVEKLFGGIRVWARGDERAPHKPLLLLYALGRLSRNEPRLIPYADVDRDLRSLLVQFGPHRKSQHPE